MWKESGVIASPLDLDQVKKGQAPEPLSNAI
jgi:hypothetical protein